MKTFNYFYDGQPIPKKQFLAAVPATWEKDVKDGSFSWGYYRVTEISGDKEEPAPRNFSDLGAVIVTAGVYRLSKRSPEFAEFVQNSLSRFTRCDWGDLEPEDKYQNDLDIDPANEPGRVLARYNSPEANIYIITEWDRTATTILFPSEY